jgi:hypothetical protein
LTAELRCFPGEFKSSGETGARYLQGSGAFFITTIATARRSRNQKNRNISRKDAKAAKKKKQYLSSELGVLRSLAGGLYESEMFHVSEISASCENSQS